MQIYAGAEMEAYGSQVAAVSSQYFCKSREEPSKKY